MAFSFESTSTQPYALGLSNTALLFLNVQINASALEICSSKSAWSYFIALSQAPIVKMSSGRRRFFASRQVLACPSVKYSTEIISDPQTDIEASVDPENPQDKDTPPHVEVDIKVDGVSVKDSKKQD